MLAIIVPFRSLVNCDLVDILRRSPGRALLTHVTARLGRAQLVFLGEQRQHEFRRRPSPLLLSTRLGQRHWLPALSGTSLLLSPYHTRSTISTYSCSHCSAAACVRAHVKIFRLSCSDRMRLMHYTHTHTLDVFTSTDTRARGGVSPAAPAGWD